MTKIKGSLQTLNWNGTWSGIVERGKKSSTYMYSLIEEIVAVHCVEADILDYVCSIVE